MNAASRHRAICTVTALALAGCATIQGGPQQSALDRSINQCMAAVGIGAVLGALGAHGNNRGRGAVTGAAVGGVVCGVLMAINNEQDKQQVRNAQLAALNAGMQQTQQFVGQDGQTKVVQTSVREVATPPTLVAAAVAPTSVMSADNSNRSSTNAEATSPDRFVGPCRNTQSAIMAQGQTVQLSPDLYCRTAGGDWKLYGVV